MSRFLQPAEMVFFLDDGEDVAVHAVFEESKHKRGGDKENPGRFSEKEGSHGPRDDESGLERLAATILQSVLGDGGVTIDRYGVKKTSGFVYSPYEERTWRSVPAKVTDEAVSEYVQKNEDLWKDERNFIGGWVDDKTGEVVLDVVVVENDHDTAMREAEAHNQHAIYDLNKGVAEDTKHGRARKQASQEEGGAVRSPNDAPGGDRAGPAGDGGQGGWEEGRYHEELLKSAAKSRTFQGIVDVSASPKKRALMAPGIENKPKEEIARQARSNLDEAFGALVDAKDKKWSDPKEVAGWIDGINRTLGKGIVREGVLLREDDSKKFPYAPAKDLEGRRAQFAKEFTERIDRDDPVETAAWVHWRLNMVDHPYADGVGRTAEMVAAYVLMRHGHPMPSREASRDEWYGHAPKSPDIDYGNDYRKWVEFYRSLFTKEGAHGAAREYKRGGDKKNPGRFSKTTGPVSRKKKPKKGVVESHIEFAKDFLDPTKYHSDDGVDGWPKEVDEEEIRAKWESSVVASRGAADSIQSGYLVTEPMDLERDAELMLRTHRAFVAAVDWIKSHGGGEALSKVQHLTIRPAMWLFPYNAPYHTGGSFNMLNGEVCVNHLRASSDLWTESLKWEERVEKTLDADRKDENGLFHGRYFSEVGNVTGLFMHELGHAAHFFVDSEEYARQNTKAGWARQFGAMEEEDIATVKALAKNGEIGTYAMTNVQEYVAEAWVRQLLGRKMSPEAMALYEKWNGPKVNRQEGGSA